MRLKQLQAKLAAAQKNLEATRDMLAAAQGKTGDEAAAAVETAQKAFDLAKTEFDAASKALETEIANVKALARAKELDEEAKKLSEPNGKKGLGSEGDDPEAGKGAGGEGDRNPAEPRDHQKAMREQEELFFKFVQGGGERMTGQELKALEPANQTLARNDEGTPVATIPKRLVARILPGLYPEFSGKALPMASTDNDAAGGRANLVWPDYGTELRQLPPDEPSLFLRVTKKTTVGGSLVETRLAQDDDNEFGGVAVEWTDEEDDAPETEMEIERVTIPCYPIKAYTSFTRTLARRSRISLEMELADKLRKAMLAKFDRAIMHGSGTKQPLGIRIMDGVREVARQAAGAVCYDDLVNVEHAVRPSHRTGASFAMEDTVLKALKKVKDQDGRPIFASNVGSGPLDRLDNWPYFVSTRCSALGTAGDLMFGNLLNYWLVIEEDIVIARSEHAEFKKGGIAFRVDALVGGRPMYERAFAILVGADGS